MFFSTRSCFIIAFIFLVSCKPMPQTAVVEYKDYQSELKYLLEESGRLDTMADLVRRVNETGNTLVLVDRTECGRQLVERLGDGAVFVSGATKVKARQDEYDEVADATGKIIVATYGVAAVGINIPRIFNLDPDFIFWCTINIAYSFYRNKFSFVFKAFLNAF